VVAPTIGVKSPGADSCFSSFFILVVLWIRQGVNEISNCRFAIADCSGSLQGRQSAIGNLNNFDRIVEAKLYFAFRMNSRVLVLNASFEPINVCTARRAVVLILKGVANAEESSAQWLHSSRFSMPMPSVIRLMEYIHIPFERKSLSRKNILLRDHNTCQYCGRVFPPQDLTLDHIAPRSRGGDSAWENLVTCCRSCNNRKGDRSPEGAGMRLLKRPQAYNLHVNRQIIRYLGRADEAWRKYLFY
jgi:5-methylcytosine-specific restriction endonuclease McrA